MEELHLIGYTADLEHLVLDVRWDGAGLFRVPVDEDLAATVEELLQMRTAAAGGGPPSRNAAPAPSADPPTATRGAPQDAADEWSGTFPADLAEGAGAGPDPAPPGTSAPPSEPAPEPRPRPRIRVARPEPTRPAAASTSPRADEAPAARPVERATDLPVDAVPPPVPPQRGTLSPAQIQTLLRSGKTAEAVAAQAGADLEWIQSWEIPIRLERVQIIGQAQAGRLERARLGLSRATMGDAVAHALAEKGVELEDVTWRASRRKDGKWRVAVSYASRGRKKTASWLFEPGRQILAAQNDLGGELGFAKVEVPARTRAVIAAMTGADRTALDQPTDDETTEDAAADAAEDATEAASGTAGPDDTDADEPEAAAATPAPAKKTPAKKAPAKKAAAKKAAAKKPAAKKAPAKKPAAKKPAAKKAPAKKPAAEKPAAEKAPAGKAPTKKAPAKKAAAKKPAVRKAPAKKAATTRTPARTTTPMRSVPPRTPGAQPTPAAVRRAAARRAQRSSGP